MTLVHKNVTPKQLAANRANAQKSTGPRTKQGICTARMNAIKHLVFAQAMKAHMREVGEDPEEYEALRQALCRAFGPQDEFEQMLVEEMAQIHWRRQRLVRAESGLAASQRRQLEIERELQGGAISAIERMCLLEPAPKYGFAGMAESTEKCDKMLRTLYAIRECTVHAPLQDKLKDLFRIAYGEHEELSGGHLKEHYDFYRMQAKSAPPEEAAELRAQFLAKVDKEVASYKRLKALLLARDVETTPAMKDAQLMPETDRLDAFTRYDSGLEKQFENKVKLLVAWRSAKRAWIPDGGTLDERALPATR